MEKQRYTILWLTCLLAFFLTSPLFAQKSDKDSTNTKKQEKSIASETDNKST